MDNSNQQQMNRQIDHLGVNKLGKNIKKSPIHQPSFGNGAKPQAQAQPQVYNINKNDFRNIVQRLTGSPAREPPPRPPQNNRKPPNNRLMRVRPPPLAPSRPQVPVRPPHLPAQPQPLVPVPYPNNNLMRPQYDQLSPPMMLPPTPPDVWSNTTESPITAYMRYLQTSIIDQNASHPHMQPQYYPNPAMPHVTSPRVNGTLPSPRMNGPPPLLPSPGVKGPPPNLPSPRINGPPPLLPSPTSQFLLPSPTGFVNLLSPRSSYPLLSPGYQFPPNSPGFSFSPMGQSGILGPGPHPPPSPGYGFPLSPGFFHVSSPRWRDQ